MASPHSPKIIELRQRLAEQFGSSMAHGDEAFETGQKALDEMAVPKAALTEIVSDPFLGQGGPFLLQRLLRAALPVHRTALIDGRDCFDPSCLSEEERRRLLWLRCGDALQAVRAADLLLRDGNLSLVLLLLSFNPLRDLQRIQAQAWQRLQLLAEKSGSTLMVFTPSALVGNAALRISAEASFSLQALNLSPCRLEPALRIGLLRRKAAWGSFGGSDALRSSVGA